MSSFSASSAPRPGGSRIGLLVPSPNTVAETEFWHLSPSGTTVHTSRMPLFVDRHDDALAVMERTVSRVLEEACTAEPDVIAYGCTASSARPDPLGYETKLCELAGRPVFTAACALLAALAQLRARRIALLTPYPQSVNDKERRFFAGNGIEVMVDRSIIVDEAQHRLKNMCRVPAEALLQQATELGQRADVEAIVLSCCDMRTLDVIGPIEAATGKPVTSSNQALFWRVIQCLGNGPGNDGTFAGAGSLLN